MKTASWEKAKNIFEQAMVVAPDERGQFLDAVCADDEIVRREVEELLSSFDETESFLETPAVAGVAHRRQGVGSAVGVRQVDRAVDVRVAAGSPRRCGSPPTAASPSSR